MKFKIPSLPESRSYSWSATISWIAMFALLGIALGGLKEWFRADLPYSVRAFHLLLVLFSTLLLATVAFSIEHFTRSLLSSRVLQTRNRLRMAMVCGKSVGWDADRRVARVEWFGDLENMFGIRAESFSATADDFYRYVHPDDRERVAHAIDEAEKDRTPYSTEFRVVRNDGAVRWVSANGKFQYATNGAAERMLGIAVDITDRKRVEEALTKSEERFSKAFRESPTAITLTRVRDHRYLDVNETFQSMTGWTRDEVIGRTPFDLEIWANPFETEQFAREVLQKHSIRNMEIHFRRKDRSQRTGLGAGELMEIDGEPCILSAIVDITDRKHAEELLRRKQTELTEAQRSAHMGSWQWNPDNNQLSWSSELYELHGLDPNQLPPSVEDLPKFFSPESWRVLKDTMTQALTTGSVGDVDAELIRPDGSSRWIYVRGQAVLDTQGKLVSFAGTAQDITERKRMEQKLHDSEERLRLAVQAGKMYVFEWDPSSDVIVRSPEYVEVLGKDEPRQISRRKLLERVPSEDHNQLLDTYSNLTPERPTVQVTYRFTRVDGSLVRLEKRARGIFDEAGKLVKVVGVVADITDRKRAERALQESEERFRRVVEQIEDALAVDDRDGHILFANDQFLNLFGFTREELAKVSFEDYVAPEYLATARERHQKRMRGEPVPTRYEYQALRRDGRKLWIDAEIVSIKGEQGEFVGTQKLLRDVTDRKTAEELLRESEERFRLVANSAPVMIWMAGTDKLRNYFNRQWLEFTGHSLESDLGMGWAENVHPDDFEKCLRTYTEAFDCRDRFQLRYRLRRCDGEYRWIHDVGVPRFNAENSFVGYIGSCMDVTEQKIADEALAGMGRKLMEAHEEERTWLGRELHDDINQRLALVAVELDRGMQHSSLSTAESREFIDQAKARVIDISKDLQALSHRLHSSKLEYLGLGAAAKSFCNEFAEQYAVQVHFSQTGLPRIMRKEVSMALFRVLQEALQNALKHSGVQEFLVELRGTEGAVELRVSDAGLGFDEQQVMAHHGLGLISMRERLQLVDGEFSIHSRIGFGTTVHASVPLSVAQYTALAG